MKYRKFSHRDLYVSEIGLGTNNFGTRMDYKSSREVIHAALDYEINFLDTADKYGDGMSEKYIGRALKGQRSRMLIATKFGYKTDTNGYSVCGSAKYLKSALEASLNRLQTDYIDLYQMHVQDNSTPIEETIEALNNFLEQGKIRYFGLSNFDADNLTSACIASNQSSPGLLISYQPEYSLVNRDIEHEILPICEEYHLGILPFYPLAHGFLTGKYKKGHPVPENTRLALWPNAQSVRLTDRNFEILEKLENFVRSRKHKLVDLAFAWLLSQPLVKSVIAGASNVNQVMQNAQACEWVLNSEDIFDLDLILNSISVPTINRIKSIG